MNRLIYTLLIIAVFLASACTTPRGVIESGRVTPKKHVRVNLGTSTYVPTAFVSEVGGAVQGGIGSLINDTFIVNSNVDDITDALVSYALDPLTQSFDFVLKYGLVENMDVGYKYTGGKHALDAQYQIVGPEEHNHYKKGENFSSSIGVQYSSGKYELPSFLGDVQNIIGFSLARKDVLIKSINSLAFGENEVYGHFGFGLMYNQTFTKYGLEPKAILTLAQVAGSQTAQQVIESLPSKSNNFGAYGFFINIRGGYKHVYAYGAFSMLWQNYGKYEIFEDIYYEGKGFTFIPSFGLQFDI